MRLLVLMVWLVLCAGLLLVGRFGAPSPARADLAVAASDAPDDSLPWQPTEQTPLNDPGDSQDSRDSLPETPDEEHEDSEKFQGAGSCSPLEGPLPEGFIAHHCGSPTGNDVQSLIFRPPKPA